jgi:hypothetical protein
MVSGVHPKKNWLIAGGFVAGLAVAGMVTWVALAGNKHTYRLAGGRVVQGEMMTQEPGFFTLRVRHDSRGEVPAGEKILVFRRDLKEVR